MKARPSSQSGFTLTEFLIVLAVMVILLIVFVLNFKTHQGRARDARRRADLDKIKITFEDYYNDHNCYPPSDILDTCRGEQLEPYLDTVPCDPFTHQPYVYLPDEDNACKGYRLLTKLEDDQDPAIAEAGCNTSCGCGFGSGTNYGISSGLPLTQDVCTEITLPVI